MSQGPRDILDFWFSERARSKWWSKDEAFDREVEERLGGLHGEAASGRLDAWIAAPEGALAVTLLLDQVPRNVFRGTPRAFATDPQARVVTRAALAAGHDRALPSDAHRLFLYLPLEHSEELADQEDACRLTAALSEGRWYDFAVLHRDIIARFGRFPHRNAILGRESSAEELEFLGGPNSSF
ncbi:MAG: DUF924 domain-containing protein [Myxococcales bacterium]|nr:DUF924 domain-containing protein [Myxococcales bacterium]